MTTETKAPEKVAQPAGQAKVETKPTAPAKPVEAKAPDTKSPEVKPTEAKVPEAKPAEAKAPEAPKPETKAPETPKPVEAKPAEKPAEVKTPEAPKPAEVKAPEAAAPEVKTEEPVVDDLAGADELRNVLLEMREHFKELQTKSFASYDYGGAGSYVGGLEETEESQSQHPAYMDEEIDDVISLIYNLLDMVEYFFEVVEDGVIDRKEIQGLKIRIATTAKTYELLSERYFPDDEDNERTSTLFETLKSAIDTLQPTQPAPAPAPAAVPAPTPAPVAAPPAPGAAPEAAPAPSPAPVDTGAAGGFPMTPDETQSGTMGAKGPDEVKSAPKVEINITQTFEGDISPEAVKTAGNEAEKAVVAALTKSGVLMEEKHDHGKHDPSDHRHDPVEAVKADAPVDAPVDANKLPLTGDVTSGLLEVTRAINHGVRKATTAVFGDDATRKQKLKDAAKRAKEQAAAQSSDDKKLAPLREKANGMAKEIFGSQIGVLNKTGKIKKHGVETKSMGKLHEATIHFKAGHDAFKGRAADDPELAAGVAKNGVSHYLDNAKKDVPEDKSHEHLANMIEHYVSNTDTSKGVNVGSENRFKEIEMCHKCFQKGKKLLDGIKCNEKV